MAKLYETAVLIDATLDEPKIEERVTRIETQIKEGGELLRTDRWGKRRMAYDISGRTHADYMWFYYHVTRPGLVTEIERVLRLDESVLRFLTVVDNSAGIPPETPPEPRPELPDPVHESEEED